MRNPWIGGNWKLHGTQASSIALAEQVKRRTAALDDKTIVVFPPYVYLPAVNHVVQDSNLHLGAQNQALHEEGAFTGEVAPGMLTDVGCEYVLLGHSERRHVFNETNDEVAKKFILARSHGLLPVLCVGETLLQRDVGETDMIIREQLDAVINRAGINAFTNAVIAYEPVWAIGTGKVASPEEAQTVHAMIRSHLNLQNETIAANIAIVYGGSLKPGNAAEIFAMQDVDGGLIGGAALKAEDFVKICESCTAHQ
jgi:triosephosphate isomerase (TIM)